MPGVIVMTSAHRTNHVPGDLVFSQHDGVLSIHQRGMGTEAPVAIYPAGTWVRAVADDIEVGDEGPDLG
jgi:hypothetical protein